jgi:hypothetical protein
MDISQQYEIADI